MRHYRTLSAGLAALLILAGCGRDSDDEESAGAVSRSWNPTQVKQVRDVPIEAFRASLQNQIAKKPEYATDKQWASAKRLYAGYHNAPLWFDEDGLVDGRAEALVDALINATSDAIRIDQYPLYPLAFTLDSLRRTKDPSAQQIARADLMLSASYVALGEDYLVGQIDPRTVGQSWHIDPKQEAVDSAVTRSLRSRDLAEAIARMRPQGEEYNALRQKLEDYRKLLLAGGWTPIPDGPALKRGRADSSRLELLRGRLRAEGLDAGSGRGTYDQPLAAAVAQFQQRHGIVVDSQVGEETLDAMNVPTAYRLAQIAANLERYRWMPRTLGSRYILVNVPAFRLEGYDNGEKSIEMKVIVGAEYEGRATPVFSDKMEYVIFRPYWDVPPKIAANEFTNGIPSDFELTSRGGEPHLRQRPGAKNALGLVKFMFPNDFNIYLHDTPNDALFSKDVRAFSHGCIRLEKPAELAQWVLGWDESKVRDAMESGRNDRTVHLPQKIPVYIAYFTTYVRDGQLWFGNDLYGRDTELVQSMASAAVPSPSAIKAINALRTLTD